MSAPTPCAWAITLDRPSTSCTVHPGTAYPWRPRPGCSLPPAQICAVCVREVATIRNRFEWPVLCHRCEALDVTLGRMHDGSAMTPNQSGHGRLAATVFDRVEPEAAIGTEVRDVIIEDDGVVRVVTASRDTLLVPMVLRRAAHLGRTFGELAGDRTGTMPLTAWQAMHPPTTRTVAHAFQAYVTAVHPWVRGVEPRVDDIDWLMSLLTDGRADDAPGPAGDKSP